MKQSTLTLLRQRKHKSRNRDGQVQFFFFPDAVPSQENYELLLQLKHVEEIATKIWKAVYCQRVEDLERDVKEFGL